MPVTPLHMGPGLLVKAVCRRHFSLMVFGFSQVAIDIEPIVRVVRGDPILHGFTHTYAGATLIAIFSVIVGRPVCQYLLGLWKDDPTQPFMNWLRGPAVITWPAAIAGAVVGAYSHVFLDSIMHSDMKPMAPASESNPLYQIISVDALHYGCLATGVIGTAVLIMIYVLRARRSDAKV